jgi:glutathione S-transferase
MDVATALLDEPALTAWGLANCVVALKMMAVSAYTSSIRMRKGVFISPEDYALQGLEVRAGEDPDVERARRMHRNDLENHLAFALVGLVYALTGPSTLGVWLCFAGFPLARIAHSVSYARGWMPHRTVAFGVGYLICAWMALSSIVSLL